MTCREFADFLADYQSGDLAPEVRAQFEHHLSLCSNCTAYLANYQAAVRLGKRAFAADDGPLPADVPEDLVRAILEARRQ